MKFRYLNIGLSFYIAILFLFTDERSASAIWEQTIDSNGDRHYTNTSLRSAYMKGVTLDTCGCNLILTFDSGSDISAYALHKRTERFFRMLNVTRYEPNPSEIMDLIRKTERIFCNNLGLYVAAGTRVANVLYRLSLSHASSSEDLGLSLARVLDSQAAPLGAVHGVRLEDLAQLGDPANIATVYRGEPAAFEGFRGLRRIILLEAIKLRAGIEVDNILSGDYSATGIVQPVGHSVPEAAQQHLQSNNSENAELDNSAVLFPGQCFRLGDLIREP